MSRLYQLADAQQRGAPGVRDLRTLLGSMGFKWLKDEDVAQRFDADGDGIVTFAEFVEALPKTLRTNLIKLAKKNGEELGFLA